MNLVVKTPEDEKELAALREFMLKQPQFYPRYQEWVDGVCVPGIEQEDREAIFVMSDRQVVGDVVFRQLQGQRVEIKNFRIDEQYRRRDLGHFLLNQVERVSRGGVIVLDVSVGNFPAVEFFTRNMFHIVGKSQLYVLGQEEYLMEKSIKAA